MIISYDQYCYDVKDKTPVSSYYSLTISYEDYWTGVGIVRYTWTTGKERVERNIMYDVDRDND